MKSLVGLFLVAVVVSGCAQRYMTPEGPRTHFFLQRGVMLQVTHTCTDRGVLYQAGGVVVTVLGATPRNIPLDPVLFDRNINVTFQSLDQNGNVVGTFSQRFPINQRSTTTEIWTISDGNRSGGSGKYSRCSW